MSSNPFNRTGKELKPDAELLGNTDALLLIEPERNWNAFVKYIADFRVLF